MHDCCCRVLHALSTSVGVSSSHRMYVSGRCRLVSTLQARMWCAVCCPWVNPSPSASELRSFARPHTWVLAPHLCCCCCRYYLTHVCDSSTVEFVVGPEAQLAAAATIVHSAKEEVQWRLSPVWLCNQTFLLFGPNVAQILWCWSHLNELTFLSDTAVRLLSCASLLSC